MKNLKINEIEYSTETVSKSDWLEQRKYPKERLLYFYRTLRSGGWRIGRNSDGKPFEDSLEIGSLAEHFEYIDKLGYDMFQKWRNTSKLDDFTAIGIWRQLLSLRIVEYQYAEENDLAYIKTANRNADCAHEAGFIDDLYYLNLKWRISQELDFACDTPLVELPGLRERFLKSINRKIYLDVNEMTFTEKMIFDVIKKLITAGCNADKFKGQLREIANHKVKVALQYSLFKLLQKVPSPLSTLAINDKIVLSEFELNNIFVESY